MASVVTQPCDEGVIESGTASAPCSKASGRWVLAATILGSSMAFIDGTVVNIALPALQANLNATVVDVQWVIESYALFLAALLLVGGSLGDHYGRRRIFCWGVMIFALASIGCGLATDIKQLIIARSLQGIGAALLVPGSLAIISASFREEERGQAIGTWSGFTSITAAVGPVLGGWLIEHVSWRAIFFINVPVAAAVLLIAYRHVPESFDKQSAPRLDWPGAVLATIGLGAIVYGLIESSRLGIGNPVVLAAICCGVISLIFFLIVEVRSRNPMLSLELFRSRNFSGANVLTLLLYTALGGTFFFLPLNLIQVQRYSATAAGAAMLPFILIMFLLSRWSGGLIRRYGARLPLIAGPMIAALGFALLALPGIGGSFWTTFFPGVVVLGLGMAGSVAPLTTTVMNSVSENRAGIASGINNAVSRVASLMAVAVFGLVMLHAFNAQLERKVSTLNLPPKVQLALENQQDKLAGAELPASLDSLTQMELKRAIDESFVAGFRRVMTISVALALLSSLSAALFIDGKEKRRG
jgi:EmrB/QacA subfamily drug resistance transporter